MTPKHNAASGNVLLYVLIGIALFGALMFVITRENRYDTGSTENAALEAQQITTYAEKINGTVQNLIMQNHCLVSQVSFLNSTVSGYSNGTDLTQCQVFDQTGKGGGMDFETPPAAAVDTATAAALGQSALAGNYLFVGDVCVANTGTSCASGGTTLLMVMPFVTQAVCAQINQIASGSTTIPTLSSPITSIVQYTGTLTAAFTLGFTSGTPNASGCFKANSSPAGYDFYEVLVAN